MKLELARAAPEDAATLAAIAAASFRSPWSEPAFRAELEREGCRALLARSPSGGAGYGLGRRLLDEVDVLSFAVAPLCRGRGVGTRLLARYLGWLRDEGVRRVTLEVAASNRAARALYERLGLACEGRRPGYYPGGEAALLYGICL
jgi:ribosomal-protein-alanine N-acetyltransferase